MKKRTSRRSYRSQATGMSKAIVLSHSDFGEADKYVELFTQKWGVLTALAKSARKSRRRYVGGLDLFCHNEVLLRGDPKETPYLVELKVLNSFGGIRETLPKMLQAGKILHWTRRLFHSNHANPMPQTYSLLGQTLTLIEKESDPGRLELLALVFKTKLLAHLGLRPSLDRCVRCEETQTDLTFFDIASGGLVCRTCLSGHIPPESFALEPEDQKLLMVILERFRLTQWQQLNYPTERARPLLSLMTKFASYHTHVRL